MSEQKMKLFHPDVIGKPKTKTKPKKGGSNNGNKKPRDNNASERSTDRSTGKDNAGNSKAKAE